MIIFNKITEKEFKNDNVYILILLLLIINGYNIWILLINLIW